MRKRRTAVGTALTFPSKEKKEKKALRWRCDSPSARHWNYFGVATATFIC